MDYLKHSEKQIKNNDFYSKLIAISANKRVQPKLIRSRPGRGGAVFFRH
jgi:hypothetical protein